MEKQIFSHGFTLIYLLIVFSQLTGSEVAKGVNEVTDNDVANRKRPTQPQIMAPLTTDLGWIQQTIARHNYYRQFHNAQPLRFNKTLCEISQAYANRLARENLWGHNYGVLNRYQLGENLARYIQSGSRRSVAPLKSVDLWYDEIDAYDFKTGGQKYRRAIGHFTQLVWKSTQEMGVAMAFRRDGNKNYVYVVANYYPRGNVQGLNLRMVSPPRNMKRPRPRSEVWNDNETMIEDGEDGVTMQEPVSSLASTTYEVLENSLLYMSTPLFYYFNR